MMFTTGRYIVIDDNIEELRALVEALHELGAPGIGVHYKAETGVRPEVLAGVRVLFLDLHLISGVQIGEQTKAYDVIVQLLSDGIGTASGPYVIVLWTSHSERTSEFEKHLLGRLEAEKRPLAVLYLDKNEYLKPGGKADAEKLKVDVSAAIASDPRLHALLLWEHDVLSAAGATLSELGALIQNDARTPERYGPELDRILSVLAQSALGADHAKKDIRAAVSTALAPILLDRIVNQRTAVDSGKVWEKAVTQISAVDGLETGEAARLNSMLHLALPPTETTLPHDWGALILLPNPELEDEATLKRFALKRGELMFKVSPAEKSEGRAQCRLALVRVGASCDYAQNKVGPIPYILGVIVPDAVELRDEGRRPKSQIETPVLMLPDIGPVRIFVDARFHVSLVQADVAGWPVIGRLREQLLMQISSHCAEYSMRPGIVSIRPAAPPPATT